MVGLGRGSWQGKPLGLFLGNQGPGGRFFHLWPLTPGLRWGGTLCPVTKFWVVGGTFNGTQRFLVKGGIMEWPLHPLNPPGKVSRGGPFLRKKDFSLAGGGIVENAALFQEARGSKKKKKHYW